MTFSPMQITSKRLSNGQMGERNDAPGTDRQDPRIQIDQPRPGIPQPNHDTGNNIHFLPLISSQHTSLLTQMAQTNESRKNYGCEIIDVSSRNEKPELPGQNPSPGAIYNSQPTSDKLHRIWADANTYVHAVTVPKSQQQIPQANRINP